MRENGDMVAVRFKDKDDDYLDFIRFCFANVLIHGAHVKIVDVTECLVFVTIAGPGIDRIDRTVLKFEGQIVL